MKVGIIRCLQTEEHALGCIPAETRRNPCSVICLQHLQENENNILGLLSCESSELFCGISKTALNRLIRDQFVNQNRKTNRDIPQDFLINHISGSFVEMVLWVDTEQDEAGRRRSWTAISGR